MRDLTEAMARNFYEQYEQTVLFNVSYSKTTLASKKFEDLSERTRLNYIEAMKKTLALPEILQVLKNRAALL